MTPAIYVYKLVCDDGGAPFVTEELLSLAICKPGIRSTAEPGAIIFGIGSVSEPLCNRLVYIAVVTAKETNGHYYEKAKYASRADCIYERNRNGQFRRKPTARYHEHPANLEHDLGSIPDYQKASVLLSSDFRYFGSVGTADYKASCPELKSLAQTLRQGHRINHAEKLRAELINLKEELWQKHPRRMSLGSPTQRRAPLCEINDDCYVEICSPRGPNRKGEVCGLAC